MAGSRIQGITIEIGGDTTKLSKALSGINKDIKSTQTQLRDVEKLLKLDPKNTELLAQKQKLLKNAISETREKLETLRETEKQLKDSGVDKNSEQFQGLRREIIETEGRLKDLEDQAKKSTSTLDKIGEIGGNLQETGSKISAAGKKMLGATAAVTGLGTAAVSAASSFETSMSQVQATMGIAADAVSDLNGQSVNTMNALSELAKEMGSTTAFSASECAEALNYLALAGYNTQEMADTLPVVLNLAAAGGIDLASASDMVTDAMSALGIETKRADKLVDQMAKTASSSNTSVSQLGEAILTIGATGKTVAGGTAELSAALGILANNGIKGSEGGTKLRNVIMSLQTPTDKAATLMSDLSIAVFDANGNMRPLNDILGDINAVTESMTAEEKQNIISKIFNKTDIAAANALLSSTGATWADLESSIGNSGGAAQQMADTQLNNLNGQMTLLKSALEGLAISFGEILLPVISSAVEKIQEVVDSFNSLDESQKTQIVEIAAIVAAIGPALIALGSVVTAIGHIMTAVSGLSTLLTEFGSLMSGAAGPIAIIGAIIALLAALYETNEEFRAQVNDIVSDIQANLQPLIEYFNDTILPKLKAAWDTISEAISNLATAVWDTIGAAFTDFLLPLFDDIVNDVIPAVVSIFMFLWDNVLSPIADFISGTFSDAFNGIADIFRETIIPLIDILAEGFRFLWDGVLTPLCEFMQAVFGPVFEDVFGTIGELFTDLSDIFHGIIEFITGVFTGDWSRAWEGIKDIFKGVVNGIISIINLAIDGINWILTPIRWIIAQVGSLVGLNWSTDNVSIPRIPMLANGGILSSGSAIVGERGPELLSVQGNQARVQPLTNNTNNYTSSLGSVVINVYGSEGQDINDLADVISNKIANEYERTRMAFA